jgi:hypothetical protein
MVVQKSILRRNKDSKTAQKISTCDQKTLKNKVESIWFNMVDNRPTAC